MMSFRIKQIGLALCLMVSLGIGHVSACACSHHVEKTTVEIPSCHSHPASESLEVVTEANVCDVTCVCFVEYSSPYIVSKPTSKELKAKDEPAKAQQVDAKIEFVAITAHIESSSESVGEGSYSTARKALLPSRAPPRL